MRNSQLINPSIQLITAALFLLASSFHPLAQVADLPTLTHDHADIGIAYADGTWDLHVHDGVADTEYEPSAVQLEVGPQSLNPIPDSPAFAFLGEPGTPSWILPETEKPHLLFLGLGTEELAENIFQNNTLTLTLVALTGPGNFVLYQTDPFGNPVVRMNSADGINASDAIELQAGGHTHANWTFTAPGEYRVALQASATLAVDGQPTTSDTAEYLFSVTYQPTLSINPKDGSTLSLNWLSLPEHEYRPQTLATLNGTLWIDATDHPIPGTGKELSFDIPITPETRFVRIEVHGPEVAPLNP
jgi:surface-anchored protein